MVLPLYEVNKIERKASKPGNLIDKYVRTQDINNAVNECLGEIKHDFNNELVFSVIAKKVEKWLRC